MKQFFIERENNNLFSSYFSYYPLYTLQRNALHKRLLKIF